MHSRLNAAKIADASNGQPRKCDTPAPRDGRRRFEAPLKMKRGHRSSKHKQSGGLKTPEMASDVKAIERRVQDLPADDLSERYHELVDRRFAGPLSSAESFELGRIEARLDLLDEDERERVANLRQEWRREREELVHSVESLLARIKASS
jgi:hypothetical protein